VTHERLASTVTAPSSRPTTKLPRKLRERGRSKEFLERVDRWITLLPRIDPRQLPISLSFSTLQFGKSFREFEATFSSLLSLSLDRINGITRAWLASTIL